MAPERDARADSPRGGGRRAILAVFAALVVATFGGGAILFGSDGSTEQPGSAWKVPTTADNEAVAPDLNVAPDRAANRASEPVAASQPSGTAKAPGSGASSTSSVHRVKTSEASAHEAGGVPSAGPPSGSSAPSGNDAASKPSGAAALLESRDDIQTAVKDMLRARVPGLKRCYADRLVANPGLNGSWRLSFVLGKDGTAQGATAEGQSMHDATFESCLVNDVSTWAILGQLAREFGPVGFPVQFGAEE